MTLLSIDTIYGPNATYTGDFAAVFDSASPNSLAAPLRMSRLVDTIVASCGINPLIATTEGTEAKIAAIDGLRGGYAFGKALIEVQIGANNG